MPALELAMIERYTTPEMGELWSEDAKFRSWLQVELAVCEAWAEEGRIPPEALARIRQNAGFDPARIAEIEEEVQHDLIAFLSSVAEHVGEDSCYIHMGLTSYDVEDTALGLRLKKAADLILEELSGLDAAMCDLARRHKTTPTIGRTHGVHAEPTSFGLKVACWVAELRRARARIESARAEVAVGKISGAVGNFAHCPPSIERRVCERLGLQPAPVSTQILQRDRHASFLASLALLAGTLERVATEIRNLQRTEILEVEEPFKKGQKGSSAMPHKRNPRLCENVTGLCRVLRANALVALENMAQWHERDLSNSAPERIILPDSCTLAHFILRRMRRVIEGLVVYPERMRANIDLTRGLVYSQRVLLALTEKGVPRDDAYRLVQRAAMAAWEGEGTFLENLLADPEVTRRLSREELEACFDVNHYLRYVDEIFERVGI